MRRVVRGLVEGPRGRTVTEIFDRCRGAVTAADERCRPFPCDRAPACVVVKQDATATTAHVDEPDLMGRRGGLGTFVRMWQACLSRCRGMGLFD